MLKMRVSEEECNAGVIFEGLTSENWPDEKFAIELICDTIPTENVQLVMFRPQVMKQESEEGQDEEEMEVCTNFRYVRRNNPAYQQKKQEEKKSKEDKTAAETKDTKKKTQAKLPPQIKNRRGTKDKNADEEKKQAEEEEERKRKELEEQKKRELEEEREQYKPK